MQGLIEFPNNPALWPSTCDVANGQFSPLIDPKEAEGVTVSCNNPFRQNIITCKDLFKEEFISEVDGLALNSNMVAQIEQLPSYIPILDIASSNEGEIPSGMSIVCLSLHDILSQGVLYKAGRYHQQNIISFRSKLLLSKNFKGKKVILFLTGSDTLIEWIWYNRLECKLFETLRQMGFWAVTGFNFSVIGGECAFAHALNQKRSLFSASLIEKHGILPIPHVYAINAFHIRRWTEWFIANPSVKIFTINCQLQKSEQDIAQIIKTVKSILAVVPYLHVLLQGFHFDKAHQFGVLLERVHFADKVAVKFAQSHRRIIYDNSTGRLYDEQKSKLKLKELMAHNILNRFFFAEQLKNKFLQQIARRA